MQRNKLTNLVLTIVLVLTALTTYAADMSDSMNDMMLDYATFNRADTAAAATKALVNMRQAAVEAKRIRPMRLAHEPDNSPKLRAYRTEMDKLIAQIDKTKALSVKGDLVQAKIEGKKLMQLRTEGHKLFR